MSVREPNRNAMFALLDSLPEDVRNVSIGKLARDDLVEVVRAVWRERDAARSIKESLRESKIVTIAFSADTDLQRQLTA